MSNHETRRKLLPENRLTELLGLLCDGELAAQEARELRDLLQQSKENRRAYIETVHLLADLRKWACSRGDGDINGLLSLIGESNGDARIADDLEISKRFPVQLPRIAIGLGVASLAALILMMLWVGAAPLSEIVAKHNETAQANQAASGSSSSTSSSLFVEDTQEIVARVVSISEDLRWVSDTAPSDFLMRLRPGDLVAIESGVAQVEFTSGAVLNLDSACKLQITSPTSARLLQGMLVGRADGDDSFTVVTPSATVVDVGTEFGVRVDETGTDVSVFDGEVHVHGLHPTEPENGFVRKLLEGMSVRVDGEGVHRNATAAAVAKLYDRRESLRRAEPTLKPITVSLLDLFAGKRCHDPVVAGSIDPVTGFWGRYQGFSNNNNAGSIGDTNYKATRWTPLIDGVFVPQASGVVTQYNSKGATINLPNNSGETWGPVWARRRLELESEHTVSIDLEDRRSELNPFDCATDRLARTTEGLLGMHANVGITFDLQAVRMRAASESNEMRLVGSIANLDISHLLEPPEEPSVVDIRFFVDGQVRYHRLGFKRSDDEQNFQVPLSTSDRYLTIVVSDSDGLYRHDLVVLVDPRIEPQSSASD